jgi:RNA polymerase sigma-70 factor, ECF subfamily
MRRRALFPLPVPLVLKSAEALQSMPFEPEAPSPAISADVDLAELEQYRGRLRLLAGRRLRNWTEAEDVAQEALRRCVEALRAGRVARTAALQAFLFQTVVHICQHRALSAGREAKALRNLSAEPSRTPDHGDALQGLIAEERRKEVRRAMDRLEPDDREVLSMCYLETLDAADVGRRLGITAGNVRVRKHRALRRLAEILAAETVTAGSKRGLKK